MRNETVHNDGERVSVMRPGARAADGGCFRGARCEGAHDFSAYPVILFDFDGTVVNTEPAILRVAGEVLRRNGYEIPDVVVMRRMIGPPLEEGFSLISGVGAEEARSMSLEYRALFDEILVPADYPVFEGVRELLDGLQAQGKRLAIATSRMEQTACRMVRELGLTQFDAVIGRVDGLRYSKAESIAAALAALDCDARDALMVGDREHDVLGAAELGMPCIGIYSGAALPGEHERAGAAAICSSVAELASCLGVACSPVC